MKVFAVPALFFSLLAIASSVSIARDGSRSSASPPTGLERRFANATNIDACQSIKFASAKSQIYYQLAGIFYSLTSHFMTSATQVPTCILLPATPADLATALTIIGQKRISFAVSSGGHASNAGFSSTTGIQISLKGFQQVTLSSDKSYVDVGPGNIWDNVYQVLEGSGVNIVGGRVSGIGAGGFITGGGGYSWKTSQYGLTVDTLISADMVTPTGSIVTVSNNQNPDLFWAIKGGGNRFGIIYNFRLATVPQTPTVYGGLRIYTMDQIPALINATNAFSASNTDKKAQILPTFNFVLGQPGVSLLAFYDAPTAPAGTFAMFDAITSFIDGWSTQTFSSLVGSAPSNVTSGQRGAFHTVSLRNYSPAILQLIMSESKKYGAIAPLHSASFISYDVEPFDKNIGKLATSCAWPHSGGGLPLNLYFAWTSQLDDAFWHAEIVKSANLISQLAISEGQDLQSVYLYPNYAISSTPVNQLFDQQSLARLRTIRSQVDPKNVMGLTTWWDF